MQPKKLFTALAAATLFVSSFAQAAQYKVGAAVYGLQGQFMQAWVRDIKKHPAVQDGTVEITVFDGKYDAFTQNSQIDTMVTQQYDAIIFVPIDTKASIGPLTQAMANGVVVVASNTSVASSKIPYVGNDDAEGGRLQAQAMADKLGGKGNVVIIQGPIGQSAQIEREKGEMEVLKKYPQMKIIEKKTANWSRAESLALTEDWLSAHPKGIAGIIAQNDDMALGALQALKSRGLTTKDIPITSIDGMPDAIQSVKRGEIVTFLQDSQAQSQGALDVALRKLIGSSYKPRSEIWARYPELKWNDGQSTTYYTPWVAVTQQNADALYKQVSGN